MRVVQCPRCAEWEAAGRDPANRCGGGSAALYALVRHHIEDHGTTAGPLPQCGRCRYWAGDQDGYSLPADVVERWGAHHYVEHALGIVWDGPGYPLRFADMPFVKAHYMGPTGRQLRRV